MENRACVGLTLATLPDVDVQPFYLAEMDVPDPLDPPAAWRRAVRMKRKEADEPELGGASSVHGRDAGVGEPIFLTYCTPQSIDVLADFSAGMDATFPLSGKIGAIASTVSRSAPSTVQRERQHRAPAVVCQPVQMRRNSLQLNESFVLRGEREGMNRGDALLFVPVPQGHAVDQYGSIGEYPVTMARHSSGRQISVPRST